MHRTFYGDESGSITTSRNHLHRYFVIGLLSLTDNSRKQKDKIKRTFRNAKRIYLRAHPEVDLDIKKEIKGSEMPVNMKIFIIRSLIERCDIKFHYALIDNHKLYGKLQNEPHITFNYLLQIYFKDNHVDGIKSLHLNLDDRNKAVGKLRDLENYLQTCLFVETAVETVKVDYHLSHNMDLIQIADIFSNTIFTYATFYMNAKRSHLLENKHLLLEFFEEVKDSIECHTNFPNNKSSYICPH